MQPLNIVQVPQKALVRLGHLADLLVQGQGRQQPVDLGVKLGQAAARSRRQGRRGRKTQGTGEQLAAGQVHGCSPVYAGKPLNTMGIFTVSTVLDKLGLIFYDSIVLRFRTSNSKGDFKTNVVTA